MEFKKFNAQIQNQFGKMCQTGKLFRSSIPGTKVWETYLNNFKPENNKTFRDPNSSEHCCNTCNNFIRRYGNIVAINEQGFLESIFSNIESAGVYTNSAKVCAKLLETSVIENVFFETFAELNSLPYESCKKSQPIFKLGIAKNLKRYTEIEATKFGVVTAGTVYEFDHFNLELPKLFVDGSGKSNEKIMSEYRAKYKVFKRAMEEIPTDTLELVRDLINQGSLLDGTAHLHAVERTLTEKKLYDLASAGGKLDMANFCWDITYNLDERIAKFRNTLIGTLCTELAEGEEINKACKNWNIRVDPVNYHKVTAPITKRQIAEAQKFVEENDYVKSFDRRLATLEDIKASEILHLNSGDGKIKEVSMFDNVKSTSTRHKRSQFDSISEVSIEKFMEDILPNCSSVEAFLENSHEGNLVTLTTANDKDSKPIFKWPNNYSWTFKGNLAGKSQIKEAVKSHGGKVNGVLRFSIMWAEDKIDDSDLDAHCIEPGGIEIYFGQSVSSVTGGNLDVDITQPRHYTDVVENITYPSLDRMKNGNYKLFVRQFNARNSKGFKAEIAFGNETFNYEYNHPVVGNVQVAEVTLKDGNFTIVHKLPEANTSKEYWGLETNNFHKVNLVCLSPNHWNEVAIGNKHFMFMLEGCTSDENVRGFHNENLIAEILKHKKVMEVLGNTNMIKPTKNHLAGIGFNSTVRDELIVRCSGAFKRMLKIKF